MEYYFHMSYILFFMSCLMFSFFYKHLLLTLISLEFLMINLLYNLYLKLMMLEINMFLICIFLTISVCESIIGLAMLIYMVQCSGGDYMKFLNLFKW